MPADTTKPADFCRFTLMTPELEIVIEAMEAINWADYEDKVRGAKAEDVCWMLKQALKSGQRKAHYNSLPSGSCATVHTSKPPARGMPKEQEWQST